MHWKENIQLWKDLVRQPGFALVTDVDGTISPIVDEPDQAYILPGVRPLLAQFRDRLLVAGVISGRAAEDVHQRVGVDGLVYYGNHGFERLYQGEMVIPDAVRPYRQALAQAAEEIRPVLLPGMMLEDKGVTLTVHYRQLVAGVDDLTSFAQFVDALTARLGLRLSHGRKVYELRPPVDIDKGTAFASLVNDFKVQAAVYLGDDTTDAAVFKKAQMLRQEGNCQSYGIGVLSSNTPADVREKADYFAEGVEDVVAFFSLLADWASASST